MSEQIPGGIQKLAAALAKAQTKFVNPEKNRTVKVPHKGGGSHTYSYATLDAVLDVVRGPLSENGLALVQLVTMREGRNVLVTQLLHESGEEIEAVYALPEGLSVQDYGAAITYARRYQVCPMLGIAGETDTDGEEAQRGQEAELELRKEEALAALRQKKGAPGANCVSAYDGRKLAEGEQPLPPATEPPKADTKAPDMTGIDPELAALMTAANITPEELKKYYVSKGHFPSAVDPRKLAPDYVRVMCKQENWLKCVAAIKGAK